MFFSEKRNKLLVFEMMRLQFLPKPLEFQAIEHFSMANTIAICLAYAGLCCKRLDT